MSSLTITWRGKSGTSYTFYFYPDGQQFDPVSGVYIFCRLALGGTWEALYVGEAQDLKQRINAGVSGHEGYRRARACRLPSDSGFPS